MRWIKLLGEVLGKIIFLERVFLPAPSPSEGFRLSIPAVGPSRVEDELPEFEFPGGHALERSGYTVA
jgi:hypothetical protein